MIFYALAPIEGLHLTCDFIVYSAALYGCHPNYNPTPVKLHETYRQPYDLLGKIPFNNYVQLSSRAIMDDSTLLALENISNKTMKDFTVVAFEIEFDNPEYVSTLDSQINEELLQRLLEKGERILDVIRLFLFTPGENKSIGQVGAMGHGISGIWFGNDGENLKFIARKKSRYELAQTPIEVNLADVSRIYNNPVFKELCSAASIDSEHDDLLARIFKSLRAYRLSRDNQDSETRFSRLAVIAEDLAKRRNDERLQGSNLRDRIAQIAQMGWDSKDDTLDVAKDLWGSVRNPLAHSLATFASLNRDPATDILNIERIVVNMIEAVVIAWRNEEFDIDAYDYLLGT